MKRILEKFKPFLLNLLVLWLIVFLYRTNNYYVDYIRQDTQITILFLAIAYTIGGLIYYSYIPRNKFKDTKGLILFELIKRNLKKPSLKITFREKTTILFLIVKIFFLPLMLNFFFSNVYVVKSQIQNFPDLLSLLTLNSFNIILFPFLVALIFLMDTLWFSFGYAIEAGFLNNKIRSVEPTILGWVVALACYPPFNSMLVKYIDWFPNLYISLPSIKLTFAIKLIVVLLLAIYVAATFALGAKCSNLTNRGIVSRGPYAIIRHPAYICKNLSWWLVIIPIMTWQAALSMSAWSIIYHLRTVTEEKHLRKDPDYVAYCKKVKYKYIPFIY